MAEKRADGGTKAGSMVMDGRERLPPLPESAWTEEQRAAVKAFSEGRGYAPLGPFWVLLYSPEVMLRAKAMGDYLRYRNSLPKDISELVILMTAREWTQQFEWGHHVVFAREAGLSDQVIDAIAEGRRPDGMSLREAVAWDFTRELLANRRVSDATYGRAKDQFGEKGVVDMAAVSGYYTMLAMVMNVAETPAPVDRDDRIKVWTGG